MHTGTQASTQTYNLSQWKLLTGDDLLVTKTVIGLSLSGLKMPGFQRGLRNSSCLAIAAELTHRKTHVICATGALQNIL